MSSLRFCVSQFDQSSSQCPIDIEIHSDNDTLDSAARNSTLHAIWSRYNCKVEMRVNQMKLDDKRHSIVSKVNIMATRADCQPINSTSMLQRKIEGQCKTIATHIQATSSDKAEVTNITAYFKVGENNKLWMLFASSVTVAPKFQDAYGYIPSLKTFTGRHSPKLICPDHMAPDENGRTSDQPKANCSMCNVSNRDDENSCSYAINFKMLAEYIETERDNLLEDMKVSAVMEIKVSQSPVNKRLDNFEDIDLTAKAAALFIALDTDMDSQIPIVELWSGLVDLGYQTSEISAMLRLEHKMREIRGEPAVEDPPSELASPSHVFRQHSDAFKVAPGRQSHMYVYVYICIYIYIHIYP